MLAEVVEWQTHTLEVRMLTRRAGSSPVLGIFSDVGRRAIWIVLGGWLSGRALRSHRRGHWFETSTAHSQL